MCTANCLIFAWIWFPSLHLHRDAPVFLYHHNVHDLHGHLIDFLWKDSFLCAVILKILGCSTFTVWTSCLVIRLTSHSDDFASFPRGILGCFTSTVLTTGWTYTFTTCSMFHWIRDEIVGNWYCAFSTCCVIFWIFVVFSVTCVSRMSTICSTTRSGIRSTGMLRTTSRFARLCDRKFVPAGQAGSLQQFPPDS